MFFYFPNGEGLTIHGSPPNTGALRRCGLALNFVTPDTLFAPMKYDNEYEDDFRKPVLMRGEDSVGAMRYVATAQEMVERAAKV